MNDTKMRTFEEVMRDHYNEIFHYIRKQTESNEDAKDLVQDVFMRIYEKYDSYNPDKASVRTWIYRIAHNQVINYLKKKYRYYKLNIDDKMLDFIMDKDDDVIDKLIKSESIDFAMMIMKKVLNTKHQKIMNLYFFSNMNVNEISVSLNIPSKTIYNTINISIQKIRKEMEVYLNEWL